MVNNNMTNYNDYESSDRYDLDSQFSGLDEMFDIEED